MKCNFRLFFEESPFFGKPLDYVTPETSPDVFIRKNGPADRQPSHQHQQQQRERKGQRVSIEEELHSLVLDDGDEEGSLVSKKRAGGGGRGRERSGSGGGSGGGVKLEMPNGNWREHSLLGDALLREGVMKEDELGEPQRGGEREQQKESEKEKEKEGKGKEKEKIREKEEDEEERGHHHQKDELYAADQYGEEEMSISPNTLTTTTTTTTTTTADRNPKAMAKGEKGKEKVKQVQQQHQHLEPPRVIHADMQWDELKELLPGTPPSKPVVNSVGTSASPFGSTRFFGHKDVIFEVTGFFMH